MTFALLPVIALIITKVIAGNIALSLGMIGALSIVRFRNPVKSPLELVIFFGLLTIGIAGGVNIKFGILLLITVLGVIIGMHIFERVAAKLGISMTALSFDEGVSAHILEISSADLVWHHYSDLPWYALVGPLLSCQTGATPRVPSALQPVATPAAIRSRCETTPRTRPSLSTIGK